MTRCAIPSFICKNSGQDETPTNKKQALHMNSLRKLPRDFLIFPGWKYWSMAICDFIDQLNSCSSTWRHDKWLSVLFRGKSVQIPQKPSAAPLPRLKPENGPFLLPLCQNVPQLPQLSKTHTNILSRFILHAWILFSLYLYLDIPNDRCILTLTNQALMLCSKKWFLTSTGCS